MERITLVFILLGVLLPLSVFANTEAPQVFTYEGRLYDSASNPLAETVTFRIEILNSAQNCLLYEETQVQDLSSSEGRFALEVGSATGAGKRTSDDPGFAMWQVFKNTGSLAVPAAVCPSTPYNPALGEKRKLRVSIKPSSTGVEETLTPNQTITSAPSAMMSQSLQGIGKDGFIQVTANITQANLETLTDGSDASVLHTHDSLYAKLSGTGSMTFGPQETLGLGSFTDAQQNTGLVPTLTAGDAGKTWYNSDTNTIMYWDGDSAEAVGTGSAGIVSINGDSTSAQLLAVGSTGTAPAWSTAAGTHTLNIPMASTVSVTAGLISKADYDNFSSKLGGTAAAGGDLTGNYPNPSIANDAVISSMILDGQVDTGDLANESVTLGKIDGTGAIALQGIRRNAGNTAWEYYTPTGDNLGNHTATTDLQMADNAIYGSSSASGDLTLDSTSDGTKGDVLLNPSGGNVGIGTTNPLAPLDIGVATATSGLLVGNALSFAPDNTPSSRQGGYIGFNSKLSGSVWNVMDLSLGSWVLQGFGGADDTSSIQFRYRNAGAGSGVSPTSVFRVYSTGALAIGSNYTPIVGAAVPARGAIIEGNVGIGTTTPTAVLHLKAGTATAGTAPLKFTAGTNLTAVEDGTMEFDGTNYFLSAGGTRYTIPLAGGSTTFTTVGSGTGSAAAPSLSFSGDTDTGFYNASSNDTISIAAGGAEIFSLSSAGLVSPTTGGGLVTTAAGSAGAPTFSFAGDPDTGWFRAAADTLAASTGGTERVRIDSSGNVGIGTTNPGYKFDINGDIRIPNGSAIYGRDTTDSSDYSLVSLATGGAGGVGLNIGMWEGNNIGGLVLKGGNSNVYVDFSQGNNGNFIVRKVSGITPTELMRVNASGNVGIGTTSPSSMLDVTNSSSNNTVLGAFNFTGGNVGSTSESAALIRATTNSGFRPLLSLVPSSGTGFLVNAVGNVGIGTTSPGDQLTLAKAVNSGNYPTIRLMTTEADVAAAKTAGSIDFYNTDGGQASVAAYMRYITSNSFGTGGHLAFGTSLGGATAGPLTEKMRIDENGNVGIGTTGPGTLLDAQATAGSVGYFRLGTTTGNPNFVVDSWGRTTLYRNLSIDASNGIWGGTGDVRLAVKGMAGQTGNMFEVNTNTGSGGNLMMVSSSGNVGVGTTGPVARLDVSGQLRVSVGAALTDPVGDAVDFVTGNTQTVTFSTCTGNALTVNLYSLLEGGNYSLVLTVPTNCVVSFTGTTAPYGSSGTAVTAFNFPGGVIAASTGFPMVFSFLRAHDIMYSAQIIDMR